MLVLRGIAVTVHAAPIGLTGHEFSCEGPLVSGETLGTSEEEIFSLDDQTFAGERMAHAVAMPERVRVDGQQAVVVWVAKEEPADYWNQVSQIEEIEHAQQPASRCSNLDEREGAVLLEKAPNFAGE